MAEGDISSQAINNRERIDPLKTGDNIAAKRAACYGWYTAGSEWVRILTDANGVVQVNGAGGSSGTQYASGTTTPSPVTGNALIFDNSGTLQDVSVANPLPVAATFSGSVNTAPTFAMTPGSSPTAAYGLIDSSYRPVVVGAGTAGSSTGGVLSVQGVSSGTALPVSGTFWQTTQPVSLTSTTITGSVAVTGTFYQTTQPVSLATNTPTLQSGSTTAVTQATASSLNATVVGNGTFITQSETQDGSGNAITSNSTTTSSKRGLDENILSILGTAPTTAGYLDVSLTPKTSGGLSSVATGSIGNTATSVKSSAGQAYKLVAYNNNSTQSYIQFWNLATGSVTVGTTAPLASIGIPPNGGIVWPINSGWAFSTAITIAITTTRAGGTSPANTVDYNILYD